MPAALVQHMRASIQWGTEMGPEILVEGEQLFLMELVNIFFFFSQVDRLLATVYGKQKSLVSFPQNVTILKPGRKLDQPP